jgi:peroxiredoxin
MRGRGWPTIAISLVAIACNAALLCWLVFELSKSWPAGSKLTIAIFLGLFLILNLVAIAMASLGTYKGVRTSSALLTTGEKARWIGFAIIALLACIGLGFWLGFSWHDQIVIWKQERAEKAKLEKFMGKEAPDITEQTLGGHEWRLKEQRGKVVVINFWATSCRNCVDGMLEMKRIYDKYKSHKDFVMVGVALDEDREEVVKFCEKYGILWPQLCEAEKSPAAPTGVERRWGLQESSLEEIFEIVRIPSAWVIDKEGNVVGMDLRGEKIERTIEKSLNEVQAIPDS